MSEPVLRLAMWSGPRNISTAMMRAWGNRPDTVVVDEPLYAHYLAKTGRQHPGTAETIAAGPIDLGEATSRLVAPLPAGKPIFYQKHMTHHLLPDMPRDWLGELTNCFLIREPKEVITSLLKHVPDAALLDTGYPQQLEIFEQVQSDTGTTPPILDAKDVLENPERMLRLLCDAVGVEFLPAMLKWSPGLHPTDGVWAKYWYKEVENTTGFGKYRPKNEPVPPHLQGMLRECEACYSELYRNRLGA